MSDISTITWEQDTDKIVVLTLDDPDHSANTMNAAYVRSMRATVERLEAERDTIAGVVIRSAKKTFFAGGDLGDLITTEPSAAARMTEFTNGLKDQLRRLETLGKPVVAAINGAALGGGLEIALACHHRIAVDDRSVVIGLPEVTLGLLPGAGGIVRTVRLLGIHKALTSFLLTGTRYTARQARELGVIDELVDSREALLPAAKAWVLANTEAAVQPWDVKGYRVPGGTAAVPSFAANLPAIPANLRRQLKGSPLEAPRAIVAAAVEGAGLSFASASQIETRYFVSLVTGQVAKNMIKANFFDMQTINAGSSRPEGIERQVTTRVGVIGAGMMGAGIAYVAAKAGIEVILKDRTLDAAARGKAYAEKIEAKALAKGKTSAEKSQALLDRITPTVDATDFSGVDLVIEAVFESVELKQQVFQEVESIVLPDAVLGSNTSTLPITTLAQGVARQDDFIGIHFFSPVDKMPLVEIITGAHTSAETLAKVFDFTLQIRKTPIVVNDSRGFFTSRVIMTFTDEAAAAVGEGVDPATVEQAALQAGYPAGPLQLMDELTLSLVQKLRLETRAGIEADGGTWIEHGSEKVIDILVDDLERKGRSTGAGFYDYDDAGKRVGISPALRDRFTRPDADIPFGDLQERMLFAEALETIRCFDEGVLDSVADANVGSILGIGFPVWTGGVIQYVNQYAGGLAGFVTRARELAAAYGPRFELPQSLIVKADRGETYE
ncbi:3-hydroxyacyl-CoA dehydrogenase NAD-binding domain-containing protein [Gordonia sp. NPDC003376]